MTWLTRRQLIRVAAGAAVVGAAGACRERDNGDDAATSSSAVASTVTPSTSSPATSPATSPDTSQGPGAYVPPPGEEWATVAPTDAGFTAGGVDALVELVGASNSQSFILLRHGRIVAEEYWLGATQATVRDIASCQKSVVSTLVGIARDQGLLRFDDTVTGIVGGGWSAASVAEEASITVEHLLTMTSGLHPRTLRAVAEPGSTWDYNTDAYQKLRRVLEAAAGEGIEELTRAWLLGPIGAGDQWNWWQRPAAPPDAVGDEAWGLQLTARDMARFGLLAMRGGEWAGERVVPEGWFAEAWAPIPQKADYGYLWWLTGRGGLASTGVPADTVAALGAQDQKIYVSPEAGVVLCRQGNAAGRASEAESDFDRALLRALVAAVDSEG